MAPTNRDVVALAETQVGKRYVWGAKPNISDPSPPAFDCSGFAGWWVPGRLGLKPMGGGTWGIKEACQRAETMIPVAEAVNRVGCLLGMDYPNEQHIVITKGKRQTVEAKGVAYGVVDDTTEHRPWNWAAQIPGCNYPPTMPQPNPPLKPHVLNAPVVGISPDDDGDGYRLAGSDGGVFAFNADFRGSEGAQQLNAPVVGIASSHDGYWLVASDGGIFAFGDATFVGSGGGQHLNAPVVGMAATPSRKGYWLAAADSGIFAYGDAFFTGSLAGQHLNQPVVAIAATPSGRGYWLVASDGGVFAFGDAGFYGSMVGQHLNQPIVGLAATPSGRGYWLVAADGGIFAFGDAEPFGIGDPLPGLHLAAPIVSCAPSMTGHGLYIAAGDGGIFAFGDAPYRGSVPELFT